MAAGARPKTSALAIQSGSGPHPWPEDWGESAVGAFPGQREDRQMWTDGSCILVSPISDLTTPVATHCFVTLMCKQYLQNELDTKLCVSDISQITWLQPALFILCVPTQGETEKNMLHSSSKT